MRDVLLIVLPFVSVLLGAWITYALNVRQSRRTKVDDVFHDAIAAVAVAHASHDFITQVSPWMGSTPDEHDAFTSHLGREGNHGYVRAVAEARAALARASADDARLSEYLREKAPVGSDAVYSRADEIMQHLRRNIDGRP